MAGTRSLLAAPTRRGRAVAVVGAVLGAVGVAASYPVVAVLGALLVLLVVVEVVAVLAAGGVHVTREVSPAVVVRGEPCHAELRLDGAQRTLVRVEATDLVDGRPVTVPLRAGGGRTARVSYDVPTTRRGLTDVGPLQVRRYGPTGMAALTRPAGTVEQVRVLPRRVPVLAVPHGTRRAAAGPDTAGFGGTDLVGLHEYVPGDDLRRLHWPTSARTGTLMVREDAEPAEPHLVVLLDDRAASYEEDGAGFEEAVEVAAGICRRAVESGHPVRLALVSGRAGTVVVAGSDATDALTGLEWLLAEVGAGPAPSHAAPDVLHPGGGLLPDVLAVVTGHRADLDEAAGWAGSVGAAGAGVVAVHDPAPVLGVTERDSVLVVRGGSSTSLAASWDAAVTR